MDSNHRQSFTRRPLYRLSYHGMKKSTGRELNPDFDLGTVAFFR